LTFVEPFDAQETEQHHHSPYRKGEGPLTA